MLRRILMDRQDGSFSHFKVARELEGSIEEVSC
jgi:hypothetical protein